MFALWLSFILKLFSTSQTFISLNSIPPSILFYLGRGAGTSLFLGIILNGVELMVIFLASVCHEKEFLAS